MTPRASRWRWLAVVGSGAVAVGALGWVMWFSALLAVDRVEVAGLQRATRPQVVAAAEVRIGMPLARVDVGAVRERVRAVRPVESVRVRRAWPATLRIRVHERDPIAAVPEGRGYLLLDEEGARVATVSKPPGELPVVRIGGAPPGAAGETSAGAGLARRSALRVLDALPARLLERVRAVSVGRDGGVMLRLRGGATVTWGEPGRAREKARVLTLLLRRDEGADTYDVSSPEVATTG